MTPKRSEKNGECLSSPSSPPSSPSSSPPPLRRSLPVAPAVAGAAFSLLGSGIGGSDDGGGGGRSRSARKRRELRARSRRGRSGGASSARGENDRPLFFALPPPRPLPVLRLCPRLFFDVHGAGRERWRPLLPPARHGLLLRPDFFSCSFLLAQPYCYLLSPFSLR